MKSLAVRFWPKVRKGAPNECWEWTASKLRNGYGRIRSSRASEGYFMAHRVSWEIANGPIPVFTGHHGACIRHKCDNRACVNPAHLEIGTQAQNLADMTSRNRRARGSKMGNAKLTEDSVRSIRVLLESGISQMNIAVKYGVSQSVIFCIKHNRTWVHV